MIVTSVWMTRYSSALNTTSRMKTANAKSFNPKLCVRLRPFPFTIGSSPLQQGVYLAGQLGRGCEAHVSIPYASALINND